MQFNIDTHAFTKPILHMWLTQRNIEMDRDLPHKQNYASLEVTWTNQGLIHVFYKLQNQQY